MQRRNFLGLLLATPFVPALAKLHSASDDEVREALAPEPELDELDDDDADYGFGPGTDEQSRTIEEVRARIMSQHVPRFVQRMVLPFSGETTHLPIVEPGRVERYVACPQKPFSGDRLATESGFELLGLAVAGEAQFDVDPDALVPTDIFGVHAYSPYIRFDRALPGQQLVMVVRNVCGQPRRFHAALVGSVPDEEPVPEQPRIWLP